MDRNTWILNAGRVYTGTRHPEATLLGEGDGMGITPSPILNHITRSGRCLTVCGVTSEPWLAGVWADATLSVDSRRETHLPS